MPLSPMMVRVLKTAPPFHTLGVEGSRKAMKTLEKVLRKVDFPGGLVTDLTVKTAKRETPVRVYTPAGEGPYPALMFMHGGGFIMGGLESIDPVCRKIASTVNCVVINVDYCLAPEHKFPEPVEECYEVAKWVYQNAKELHIDPDRIAVGGESAGANIGTAVSLLARDRNEFSLVYQVLFYPPTDLVEDPKLKFEREELSLTPEDISFFNTCYLRDIEDGKNPMASPLLADSLTGLPAACIISAERDPLREEGERYAQRLVESGVEVCYKRYPIIHGFIAFIGLIAEADEALAWACTELRKAFRKK